MKYRKILLAFILSSLLFLLAACRTTPSRTKAPGPPTPLPESAVCRDSSYDLNFKVCFPSLVQPRESVAVTIEMTDPDAEYADWVLEGADGEFAAGRLDRGQTAAEEIDIDWDQQGEINAKQFYYVYAKGDNGSASAQILEVQLHVPSITSPTTTLSCGYASFAVTSESDFRLVHPDNSVLLQAANKGLFSCGDLDWRIALPSLQGDALSCYPASGVLEGGERAAESNSEDISCMVDWSGIASGKAEDLFLVVFSFPRVNGENTASLIRIRAEHP